MQVEQTVQDMSDGFHVLTDTVDASIEDLAQQFQRATQVRKAANISGHDSQRTFRHLSAAMDRLVQARESVTLAHSSAEKEAERADIPWDCPEELAIAPAVELKVVGG